MLNLKQIRPFDAAIAVVVVLVVVLGGYLGYSVWAQNQHVKNSSPSAREIASLSAKLRANPNDFDVRMRLAQAYAVAGRDDEAIEQYQALLKVNKNYVPALSGVGFEYLKQKKWKEGEPLFRKVIELTEKDEVGRRYKPARDRVLLSGYRADGAAKVRGRRRLLQGGSSAAARLPPMPATRSPCAIANWALAAGLRGLPALHPAVRSQ